MFLLTSKSWEGAHHIPKTGGCIVASNHASNIDPITLAQYIYVEAGRGPSILAKDSLWKNPVLRKVMNATRMIPVHRNTAGAGNSLSSAIKALNAGQCIAIFPEGTHTKNKDLWPMRGKTGVARLALATGVPVIPVAQWGVHDVLPQGAKFPKLFPRKKVWLKAGPAIDLAALVADKEESEAIVEGTAIVMREITELLAQLRAEEPPAEN